MHGYFTYPQDHSIFGLIELDIIKKVPHGEGAYEIEFRLIVASVKRSQVYKAVVPIAVSQLKVNVTSDGQGLQNLGMAHVQLIAYDGGKVMTGQPAISAHKKG